MIWKLLALILSRPAVASWIINRAKRTPYFHLDGYMNRWWLFNPYQHADGTYAKQGWLRKRLPSVRVHQILRADSDSHMHDHPWNARTILLRGAYSEQYLGKNGAVFQAVRMAGDTRAIRFGEYHRINWVCFDSVYTLFFTWDYAGTWGFLVDDKKVPWREYLGIDR